MLDAACCALRAARARCAAAAAAAAAYTALTACDMWAVTVTHPGTHVTMPTIVSVHRLSAPLTVVLYGELYWKMCCIVLYCAVLPNTAHSHCPAPAVWQYSNTPPYSTQHHTLPLCRPSEKKVPRTRVRQFG